MIYLAVVVGIELKHATCNKKHNGNATQPPSCRHACGEARNNQQDRTYDIGDDG